MGVASKIRTLKALYRNWKVVRGDKVMIMEGKDKGQTGTVMRVYKKKNRLLVEGRNLCKKNIKRTESMAGGIITKEAPIHVSNVMVLDPVTGKPTRVGYTFTDEGIKVRVSVGKHASGAVIPRPEVVRKNPRPTSEEKMVSTTTVEEVYRQTSMGAQADGETLMAEALKSLVLDESQRPKEQMPRRKLVGFNAFPSSLSPELCKELAAARGLMEIPRTWFIKNSGAGEGTVGDADQGTAEGTAQTQEQS